MTLPFGWLCGILCATKLTRRSGSPPARRIVERSVVPHASSSPHCSGAYDDYRCRCAVRERIRLYPLVPSRLVLPVAFFYACHYNNRVTAMRDHARIRKPSGDSGGCGQGHRGERESACREDREQTLEDRIVRSPVYGSGSRWVCRPKSSGGELRGSGRRTGIPRNSESSSGYRSFTVIDIALHPSSKTPRRRVQS
jgi:hypothetical protein